MIDPIYQGWAATQAAKQAYVAGLPDWVHAWMGWMEFAFASSLWFALARVEARWVFLVGFATLYAGAALAYFIGWGPYWGAVHIVLWGPLGVYLYIRRDPFSFRDAYGLWLRALIVTIAISLIFDTRDVVLHLMA